MKSVKLWFTNLYFVGFYSMPNLIVIIFNLVYPIFIVGCDCKGRVLERECVKTQASEARRLLAGVSQLSFLRSKACALHMTGMRRVCTDGDSFVSWVSAGKAFPRDTHETFCSASLYWLIHTFCTLIIYTHITHKCEGELLRENPS